MQDYWKRLGEANILQARAKKPPVTCDEAWKVVQDTCARAYVSCDKLFAGRIYTGSNKDLEERFAAQKKELGQLKNERDKLTGQLNKALRQGQSAAKPTAKPAAGLSGGAVASPRGGRGGARGGGRGGRTATQAQGTWTRKDKLEMTCAAWNKGEKCDGNCQKEHKCSKEEAYGRFCWAREHTEKDHK